MKLSISIFRRLSLFRTIFRHFLLKCKMAFNLHFQETFFVSVRNTLHHPTRQMSFNLHFQETFFVSRASQQIFQAEELHFQSPFSGDFLCFPLVVSLYAGAEGTFNLHFQETFFVSKSSSFSSTSSSFTFNLHFQETFFVSYLLQQLH